MPELCISGVGVTTPVGQGREAVTAALLAGAQRFDVMRRPGRQWPLAPQSPPRSDTDPASTRFLGAEIGELTLPPSVPASLLRTASLSSRIAVATLHEAWHDAGLDGVDPQRIGLIVGGSNFQQRELVLAQAAAATRFQFLRPTYAMSFMDSDLCGICSEAFGIGGRASTVGGASASGQLAVIHAVEAVQSGQVDVCIALGAMMDLSCYEIQALRSLGAMGSDRYAGTPALAYRPFDSARDGFLFGECCGAVVVERADALSRRGGTPYARLAGWGVQVQGNRNPNPSLEGELDVMRRALDQAGWQPAAVDYVNPHGSGSIIGDATELTALKTAGVTGARINTTKSITGHGLTAAGAVEIVATVLQMRAGQLHPSRNLEQPADMAFEWVGERAVSHRMERALTLSVGFGGINTALCLQRI